MTNKLFNKDGLEVPARPCMDDKAVKTLVIENAVDKAISAKYSEFEKSEREDLIRSLNSHYYDCVDAYELAKDFESDGWDVDRQFVDKVEQLTCYVRTAKDEAEVAWMQAYQPVPPFEVGDTLAVRDFGCVEEVPGEITGISKKGCVAYYYVKREGMDDNTRLLVKWEEAKLLEKAEVC